MFRSRAVYGLVVFLSAFLLFLVEPMAAKQLLPVLGGSSAVWVTCLVFFQAALLLGYLYAWWMARVGRMWVHVALLGRRWRCWCCRGSGCSGWVRGVWMFHFNLRPRRIIR
jgi:hypothetical protein